MTTPDKKRQRSAQRLAYLHDVREGQTLMEMREMYGLMLGSFAYSVSTKKWECALLMALESLAAKQQAEHDDVRYGD